MQSMTGYAFIEKSTDQFSFSVELKSLNSRYLEIFINVPRVLRNDENELNNILKDHFNRGKLELSIDIFDWNDTKPVSLNSEMIIKYFNELKKIQKSLKISDPLQFESILSIEGITQRERSNITKKSRDDIINAINAVIKKTIEMRKKEGNATKKDIQKSLSEINKSVTTIKKLSKDSAKKKVESLKTRINSLCESPIDDHRLLSEIAILADKIDINEEIMRLNDHLNKYKTVMNESQQIGKKMDFLAQEMFREINTIASKSNSSEISHLVVEVKNHIDRMREQCRNLV